jgi:hypothetical protein
MSSRVAETIVAIGETRRGGGETISSGGVGTFQLVRGGVTARTTGELTTTGY